MQMLQNMMHADEMHSNYLLLTWGCDKHNLSITILHIKTAHMLMQCKCHKCTFSFLFAFTGNAEYASVDAYPCMCLLAQGP